MHRNNTALTLLMSLGLGPPCRNAISSPTEIAVLRRGYHDSVHAPFLDPYAMRVVLTTSEGTKPLSALWKVASRASSRVILCRHSCLGIVSPQIFPFVPMGPSVASMKARNENFLQDALHDLTSMIASPAIKQVSSTFYAFPSVGREPFWVSCRI